MENKSIKFNNKSQHIAREFDLEDIISIYHGNTTPEKGIDGIRNTLNFLTGREINVRNIEATAVFCKNHIAENFPDIKKISTKHLASTLDKDISQDGKLNIYNQWINEQTNRHGETVSLSPLTMDYMQTFDISINSLEYGSVMKIV